MLLLAALALWWLASVVLGFFTADCGSLSPGNPVLLHVGVAAAGAVVVAVPARWAWRGRRLAHQWKVWVAVAAVATAVMVYAAVSVRVTGCPFTF